MRKRDNRLNYMGNLERTRVDGEALTIEGWVASRGAGRACSLHAKVSGKPCRLIEQVLHLPSPDVQAVHPALDDSNRCRFLLRVTLPESLPSPMRDLLLAVEPSFAQGTEKKSFWHVVVHSLPNPPPALITFINSWPDIKKPEYPTSYMLDTGNVCNLRCPFCPTGKNLRGIDRGFMKRSDFDVILDKIGRHAKFISMVNWGEPFLNKDVLYFASRCNVLGIRTHIDSNLNTKNWSEEEAENIVTSGINSILGSIDGTTQETYSRYRVKGSLERALHNLRTMRTVRDRLQLKKPFLGWAFYINKFNEHQIDDARMMARDIGVDIWFKLLSCEDPSWLSKYHLIPDDPVLAIPEWVKDIYPVWSARSIVEKPLNINLPGVCVLPFSFMVINWNGDVYPCDVVYGNEFKLGNLVTQEADEVWFGQEYVKCRSFLRNYGPKQDSRSICQNHPCPVSCKSLH